MSSEQKYNILLGLSGFFPNNCGGTEVYVYNLACFLKKHGHKVAIIIPNINRYNCNYEYKGIKVYQYPVLKLSLNKMSNGIRNSTGLEYFRDILYRIKPDIIHFHTFNRVMNTEHMLIAKSMGVKTVFTTHLVGIFCARGDLFYKNKTICNGKIRFQRCMSCYIHQKQKNIFLPEIKAIGVNLLLIFFPSLKRIKPSFFLLKNKKRELRILDKCCDKIISISNWMLSLYRLNGVKNVVLIPHRISHRKNITVKKTKSNLIRLVYVGRLYPIKRIELLLQVLTDFNKNDFDLMMIVIPDKKNINYYNDIKQRYNDLGFNKWYENLSHDKVLELMKSTEILCLPSISEVAPMVIKEAFDSGIPVLGSNIPPIEELVIHNKNGLLFNVNSISSLKKQLNRLLIEDSLLQKLKEEVKPMTHINETYQIIEQQYRQLVIKERKNVC